MFPFLFYYIAALNIIVHVSSCMHIFKNFCYLRTLCQGICMLVLKVSCKVNSIVVQQYRLQWYWKNLKIKLFKSVSFSILKIPFHYFLVLIFFFEKSAMNLFHCYSFEGNFSFQHWQRHPMSWDTLPRLQKVPDFSNGCRRFRETTKPVLWF